MGKKITIDSSNMMNKIFEYIEAKKIFNLKKKQISILLHPTSFIHAIIYFKGDLIKFLAHDTQMKVPISNALGLIDDKKFNISKHHLNNINNIKVMFPDEKKFPLIGLINLIPENASYFETILITLNDSLVYKYLEGKINYISIQKNLLNIIKKPYFSKYYKLKPKNIYDIKNMIKTTENYLNDNIEYYET